MQLCVPSLLLSHSSSPIFLQGHQDGQEAALKQIVFDDFHLQTVIDIWQFVTDEVSSIQLSAGVDQAPGTPPRPAEHYAGFLAGYLATMFANQSKEGVSHA